MWDHLTRLSFMQLGLNGTTRSWFQILCPTRVVTNGKGSRISQLPTPPGGAALSGKPALKLVAKRSLIVPPTLARCAQERGDAGGSGHVERQRALDRKSTR